jgi:hypothetical protein
MIERLRYSNLWPDEITDTFNKLVDSLNAMQPKEEAWPDTTKEAAEAKVAEGEYAAKNPLPGDEWKLKNDQGYCKVTSMTKNKVRYRFDGCLSEHEIDRIEWPSFIGGRFLVSRGCEPKPEPKPLRDGDVLNCEREDGSLDRVQVVRNENKSSWDTKPFCVKAFHKKYTVVGNIFDLAAAVQRGEKIVTLDDDDIKHLMTLMRNVGCKGCDEIRAKLRKAMGGDK